jgi:type I restriction enzyme R subunit
VTSYVAGVTNRCTKLLTTGVDAQTCKLIVLDQTIQSMIEFKQTIGRGTRIYEDAGKLWFTIMDFKKATELFADPEWDGEPVVIYEPGAKDPAVPPDTGPAADAEIMIDDSGNEESTRYIVSGVSVSVLAERVQYYGNDGNLITESLRDYTKHTVESRYKSLDDFLRRWTSAARKQAVVDELREQGVLLEALRDMVGLELDPFDLICNVVYDRPPLTRRERAQAVRRRDVYTKYGEHARAVLDGLLDKYADGGLLDVQDAAILRVQPLSDLGTPLELVRRFGGHEGYLTAVQALEAALYAQPA